VRGCRQRFHAQEPASVTVCIHHSSSQHPQCIHILLREQVLRSLSTYLFSLPAQIPARSVSSSSKSMAQKSACCPFSFVYLQIPLTLCMILLPCQDYCFSRAVTAITHNDLSVAICCMVGCFIPCTVLFVSNSCSFQHFKLLKDPSMYPSVVVRFCPSRRCPICEIINVLSPTTL